ncbi:unnamed protein product [Lampetra planeri]
MPQRSRRYRSSSRQRSGSLSSAVADSERALPDRQALGVETFPAASEEVHRIFTPGDRLPEPREGCATSGGAAMCGSEAKGGGASTARRRQRAGKGKGKGAARGPLSSRARRPCATFVHFWMATSTGGVAPPLMVQQPLQPLQRQQQL